MKTKCMKCTNHAKFGTASIWIKIPACSLSSKNDYIVQVICTKLFIWAEWTWALKCKHLINDVWTKHCHRVMQKHQENGPRRKMAIAVSC
jgi:hypothetical protein